MTNIANSVIRGSAFLSGKQRFHWECQLGTLVMFL